MLGRMFLCNGRARLRKHRGGGPTPCTSGSPPISWNHRWFLKSQPFLHELQTFSSSLSFEILVSGTSVFLIWEKCLSHLCPVRPVLFFVLCVLYVLGVLCVWCVLCVLCPVYPACPVLLVRSSCLVFPVHSLRPVVFLVCPACLLRPVVRVLLSWALVRLVVCVSCVSPVLPGLSCRSSVSMCPSRPVCPVRQVCPVKPELSECGA